MIYALLVLLLAGCSQQQPWSYAPCYLLDMDDDNGARVIEMIDCPIVRSHWRMVRADEEHSALFTTPFGTRLVPRIYRWKETP